MSNDQNLTALISNAVSVKMTPEFVEKEVNSRVEKLIIEVIDRAMRTYSNTGKEVERAVGEALKVDRLDLPSYGGMVSKILKAQIEAKVSDLVSGRLAADMDELLKLAPKQIKLSEIAEDMLRQFDRDDKWGHVITVHLEEEKYGSRFLYLDEDTHHDFHNRRNARHNLLISSDGTIFSAVVDNRDLKDTRHIGVSFGLAQKIRAWVACGTKIELDYENVCTSIGD